MRRAEIFELKSKFNNEKKLLRQLIEKRFYKKW